MRLNVDDIDSEVKRSLLTSDNRFELSALQRKWDTMHYDDGDWYEED